jgi:hypothetical protein
MITAGLKAKAIARLKLSEDPKTIAEELEIPTNLVKEWHSKLPEGDLIAIEANIHAVDRLLVLDAETSLPINSEILKNTIEETALDLTRAMAIPALSGDVMHAKAIEALCNGLSKMYQTIVLKGGVIDMNPSEQPSAQALSVFEGMMRD